MPSGPSERYDFFLSRRGSVAPIAREVTDVLTRNGAPGVVRDLAGKGVAKVSKNRLSGDG